MSLTVGFNSSVGSHFVWTLCPALVRTSPISWTSLSLLILLSSHLPRSTGDRVEARMDGDGPLACARLGDAELPVLRSDGDVVIGGLFPLHFLTSEPQDGHGRKPRQTPCSGFDYRAFRWMMTMVFAVEEINGNSSLLPGVKLGYRLLDSCDQVHTSLRAALSLVTRSTDEGGEADGRQETDTPTYLRSQTEGRTSRPVGAGKRTNKTWPGEMKDNRTVTESVRMMEDRTEESTESGTLPWCLAGAPVPAVIGLASSSPTRAVAHTLGPFYIPVVSYFATCACLTEKRIYPSFLRTVPSDLFQVRGLVELVTHFGWQWVGTVGTPDDYSRYGIQAFSQQLRRHGGCLAFHLTIPKSPTAAGIRHLADALLSSKARVVVAFATEGQLLGLLLELAERNVTGIQWVASEAWVTASLLASARFHPLLEGTLGFSFPGVRIPGLREFLLAVRPASGSGFEFLNMFWEELFGCRLEFGDRGSGENTTNLFGGTSNDVTEKAGSVAKPDPRAPSLSQLRPEGDGKGPMKESASVPHEAAGQRPVCTGAEDLKATDSSYTDVSPVRISYNVYKAVYAIAHALHHLLECDSSGPNPGEGRCRKSKPFTPRQLLHHLKRVHFTNQFEEKVHFDSNGEPVPLYDIINWQKDSQGAIRFTKVGSYDGSVPSGEHLQMEESAIVWTGGQSQVPVSLCSVPCAPGSRQSRRPGEPRCCFDCLPCAEGEVSNHTGSRECTKCPEYYWSDRDRVTCVAGVDDFLSFHDTMGIILVAVTLLGVATTTAITAVFHRFRSTPVVKANNSEISFLLLMSLKLCFLCSLVFIGQPTVWTCRLRQAAFGISFVLCLSCLLVKTIVVLLAFWATGPSSTAVKCFGPSQQRTLIACTTAPQVCLCTGWLSGSPPFPFRNPSYQATTGKIVVECRQPWPPGFYLILGYIGLLASVCLVLAFLGRKLPDAFNEAKLITFSMLIFCAVWVSFIPAYVSSPGKFTVAVEIFAILASSFGLLLCLFLPKCYIILLRPERNSKKGMIVKPR